MPFSYRKAYLRLSPTSRPALLRCEALEDRAVPATLLGLTTGNALVTFDSATPGTVSAPIPVTGLQVGENLVGIDYRTSNSQLVGVGSTSRLYTIDPTTGVATAVAAAPFVPALAGTSFGLDVNPVADKLRVVSNTAQNLRINFTTGAVAGNDAALAYNAAAYDAVVGGPAPAPQIVGAAYTRNLGATVGTFVTTEYVIDSNTGLLSTQGAANGGDPMSPTPASDSPNTGVLFPVGKLGFAVAPDSGFDIENGTDTAFVSSGNKLYTVNLTTGAGTLAGVVGGALPLADVAVVIAPTTAPAGAFTFTAATATFPANRGPLALTVTRPNSTLPATVNFATSDGTAVAGVDYAPTSGTLTFGPGVTSQNIFVSLPGGPAQASAAKTFNVTLSAPTAGATLGATPTVTATIPAVTGTDPVQTPTTRFFATGAGQGGGPVVNVYNATTGAQVFTFTPFEATFTGGVTVATGDVNGDGVDDIVVGTGVGGAPRVVVVDGLTKATIADFFAYESTFTGGVNVATGDVNGDGFADVLVGSGVGGGPRVRVLSGDGISGTTQVGIADFFAYEPTFRGGVNVGAGALTGGKFADVIAGAGFGGGPRVRIFAGDLFNTPAVPVSSTPASVSDYFAYDPNFRNGVNVSSGDINGDGRIDVVTGAGTGGGPDVRAFSGTTSTQAIPAFFAFDATVTGGVRVTTTAFGSDGTDRIVAAAGPGSAPQVRLFNAKSGTAVQAFNFNAYDAAFRGGVFVG